MTDPQVERLRHDGTLPKDLALALVDGIEELPSLAELGALREALARAVGDPVPLRHAQPNAALGSALHTLPGEEPSAAELAALRARLPSARVPAPARRNPQKLRSLRRSAGLLAWLLPAAACAAGLFYWAERAIHSASDPNNPAPPPRAPASFQPSTPNATAGATPSEVPAAPSAPEPASSASTPASHPAHAASARSGDKVDELSMLREAQAALASDPARALALANRHAELFPRGVLGQEREVLAIDALTRLGRAPDARARAARFQAAHPGSAYLPRVERLIGAALSSPAPSASR